MQESSASGKTEWVDPDDAPELTGEWFDDAEVFTGDTFVRRGRGRPKGEFGKEMITLRLDPDLLAKLRAHGPGWQTQANALLRLAVGLPETMAKSSAPAASATPARAPDRSSAPQKRAPGHKSSSAA